MGLSRSLTVVRITIGSRTNIAGGVAVGMNSHSMSISRPLTIAGETTSATTRATRAGCGDGVYRQDKTLRLSRPLAIMKGRISKGSWSPEAGGKARVDSDSSTMGLSRPLAVVRITIGCGANIAGGVAVGMNSHSMSISRPLAIMEGISEGSWSSEAGGRAGVGSDSANMGLSRPLTVVITVRSAPVAGGGESIPSHPRPLVLTIKCVSISFGVRGGVRRGKAEGQEACKNLQECTCMFW